MGGQEKDGDRAERLAASWDSNAANWTKAVREHLIPSRRAGTDEAVVTAILARAPKRFLDIGCGEGWLSRRIAQDAECEVVGIDGTPQLVEEARRADPRNRYEVITYGDLAAGNALSGAQYDVIAFNYALLEEEVDSLLTAARSLLSEQGAIVIQTLHPWVMADDGQYQDGWRSEDFASFENQSWKSMPWYFRRLSSWLDVIRSAGLLLERIEEPTAQTGGMPLSLLLTCVAAQDFPARIE